VCLAYLHGSVGRYERAERAASAASATMDTWGTAEDQMVARYFFGAFLLARCKDAAAEAAFSEVWARAGKLKNPDYWILGQVGEVVSAAFQGNEVRARVRPRRVVIDGIVQAIAGLLPEIAAARAALPAPSSANAPVSDELRRRTAAVLLRWFP
jgi:hypothetical protein